MATISTATYGRSAAGLKTLKQNIASNCQRMQDAVSKSNEYTALKNTIKQYWAGVDADDWLDDLDKQISTITTKMKNVSRDAQSLLDQDIKSFKNFQTKNKV